MKNKIIILSLAAALAAGGFIATNTFAADNAGTAPTRTGFLQRIADKLNLTGDQRTQIKAILVADKDTLSPLLNAEHDARKNLRTAIRASDATEGAVRTASAKVAAADADLAVERMKLYGKIAPVLTDVQRQQLTDLQQNADDLVDNVIARIGSGVDE